MSLMEELKSLGRPGPGFKPHKQLLLLAVVQLIRGKRIEGNRVYFDEQLKTAFKKLLSEQGSIEDRDRPYNPFFHLGSSSFWKLVPNPGREADLLKTHSIAGPSMLSDLVQYAELSASFLDALRDDKSQVAMEAFLLKCITAGYEDKVRSGQSVSGDERISLQRLVFTSTETAERNPFVEYLNSLQRLNASNENALAEYQACNPFFAQIHVRHPLTQTIVAELQKHDGRQIILTGHAGDGKSTIALGVYKQLARLPEDQPLARQLKPREDIAKTNISIIKDLSERRREEDVAFMKEVCGFKRNFLIVSNTGALLDLFRSQASSFDMSSVQMESKILTAITDETGQYELVLGNSRFLVINLARIDNLSLARAILARMVDPARWASCADLPCRANCPICLNVDLINHRRDIVFERLFLAYRRMYEYGTRLTLRQITEHLSYLITSGLEEIDLAEMRQQQVTPLRAEFMFFNRFFGDNGKADHAAALQMRAVHEVRRQGFGERPCPTWERKLWLKLRDRNFQLGVPDCDSEFDILREHGSGPGNDNQPGLTPDQAREQVRRMLYFLYAFDKDDRSYLMQFLNSPTILRWQDWQQQDGQLDGIEKDRLEQRIYHVLQEHFTGVRLPEGSRGHDRRLYITLSRGKSEIRQSAQVVVAQVDWSSEIDLKLVSHMNAAGGTRTDLELSGAGRIKGARLVLSLPFLDYVLMRHFGEVGETLQAAYVERLERFKSQVQDMARETRAHVMLVRLKTDHTFRRQQYTVREGRLEVNDVL
ncbi:MAG: hypothetical protein PHW60_12810 [Kiritimatiellae bacterium]|nr:hypothetical protein [Kiritimatiellia bacterium]